MTVRHLFPVLLALLAWPAAALDYRSVAEAAALYDAPSTKAKPLFVINPGTPVELVVSLEGWSKVRDIKGDLVWIEKKYLSERRTVIIRSERAQIRANPDEKSPLVFEAERNVVLDLPDTAPAAPGWVPVRHRDGKSGFIKVTQIWGN